MEHRKHGKIKGPGEIARPLLLGVEMSGIATPIS